MVDRWMFYAYEYRDLDDYNLYDYADNREDFEETEEIDLYRDIVQDSDFFDIYEQDETW